MASQAKPAEAEFAAGKVVDRGRSRDSRLEHLPAGKVIDAHTHFFPERMFKAIWEFFEGGRWHIAHKRPPEELARALAENGVGRWTLLNYVKKEGQAAALNAWTAEFAESHPGALPFGTVHAADPDPWAAVAPYLTERGFLGIKLQPLVSEFGVDDPRLVPVLSRLADLDKILVVHTGTAPYANAWVGLDRLARVLDQFPRLRVILPHMGAYELLKALDMLERYPNLYLDTAMTFVNTDLFPANPRLDPALLERWADRILFGSDYPNIPYAYSESLDSIRRLPISEAARQKIFYLNAARLFQIEEEMEESEL